MIIEIKENPPLHKDFLTYQQTISEDELSQIQLDKIKISPLKEFLERRKN